MTCLDEERLARYLDKELAEEEAWEVDLHLAACPQCRARLKGEKAMELSTRQGLAATHPKGLPREAPKGCTVLSGIDLISYLRAALPPDAMVRIEKHLQSCDRCLELLRFQARIERVLHGGQRQPVPVHLQDSVLERWRQEQQPQGWAQDELESPLRLVIKILSRGFEVLKSSILPVDMELQPVFASTQATALRSATTTPTPQELEALVARKCFSDRELEIELMIRKESGQQISLIVQVVKSGLPLASARVTLFQDERLFHSRKAGEGGTVEFINLPPGNYTLQIPSELIKWPITIKNS